MSTNNARQNRLLFMLPFYQSLIGYSKDMLSRLFCISVNSEIRFGFYKSTLCMDIMTFVQGFEFFSRCNVNAKQYLVVAKLNGARKVKRVYLILNYLSTSSECILGCCRQQCRGCKPRYIPISDAGSCAQVAQLSLQQQEEGGGMLCLLVEVVENAN